MSTATLEGMDEDLSAQLSLMDIRHDHPGDLVGRIEIISIEVARLSNQIYGKSSPLPSANRTLTTVSSLEIEELRHSPPDPLSSASTKQYSASRLDSLLHSLDRSISEFETRVSAALAETALYASADDELKNGVLDLKGEWARVADQHAMLKEEMKEDGWLVRFRTTADQAEAMMDPLRKSFTECYAYVQRILASPVQVPFESELEEELSIRQLVQLSQSYEAMKRTYVPSVTKILRIMDKSLSERPVKNGEALRRFGDMSKGWQMLMKHQQQLDARIRLITSQYFSNPPSPIGNAEILLDMRSPFATSPDSEYFPLTSKHSTDSEKQTPGSHRSSASSTISATSAASASRRRGPSTHPLSDLSPETAMQSTVRKKSSFISNVSGTTARSPGSEWPPRIATREAQNGIMQTPTNRRTISSARPHGLPGAPSPSYVHGRVGGSPSRPDAGGSKIPIPSPKNNTRLSTQQLNVPTLAFPTSHAETMLSEAYGQGSHQGDQGRVRDTMRTPEPPHPRVSIGYSATLPRHSFTPNLGNRSLSSGSTPRTAAPARMSLGRNPPSSFRSTTPTPSARGSVRPSSRMSATSHAVNAAILVPFEPSKYDQLDQNVARIIEGSHFVLFVARVDQPLKRGQRKREDEEWKGEFVFGAGEKSSSVKLLRLAGRNTAFGQQEAPRIKCLVRSGGAWHDLDSFLKDKQARAPQPELDSP